MSPPEGACAGTPQQVYTGGYPVAWALGRVNAQHQRLSRTRRSGSAGARGLTPLSRRERALAPWPALKQFALFNRAKMRYLAALYGRLWRVAYGEPLMALDPSGGQYPARSGDSTIGGG